MTRRFPVEFTKSGPACGEPTYVGPRLPYASADACIEHARVQYEAAIARLNYEGGAL